MSKAVSKAKMLALGTAQWGWTVDRTAAFALLDAWLLAGQTWIDAATNYPINRVAADFRASEQILAEYIRAHGLGQELKVIMKVGSLSNMRVPDINLAPSFLWMMGAAYRQLLGESLHTLMWHWDTRTESADIEASLALMATLERDMGLQPGLSGLAQPALHAAALAQWPHLQCAVECKHHPFYTDLPRYAPLLAQHRHTFWVYGTTAGGLRLDGQYPPNSTYLLRGGNPQAFAEALTELRARLAHWNAKQLPDYQIHTMPQYGLLHAHVQPEVNGVILGVHSAQQLATALVWINKLGELDFSAVIL